MKDIFIDNNVAKNFCTPLDPEYKKLILWLIKDTKDITTTPHLVVSQKLLVEYLRSSIGAYSETSIPAIIDLLTREGRLKKIKPDAIQAFKDEHFSKRRVSKFKSNAQDHEHIPVVLLSERKIAITIDEGFTFDLLNFPGFSATVASRPENINYN
ncbi:hypothetical protein [Hymenobacter fodinae]|uniref:PIN domain-containing protein n=1 Tax=Hymenobacter fodinae TaxID=2510796 RepID=A0A4Z0PCY6_9BACT|nr:hypothetical protein [Hymenobacter fodinae]TGE10342.1 hypothetical protein EU556_05865 [Hymenobacter fodinae]